LFKYFDFTTTMTNLTLSINRATLDLLGFMLMFSVVFLAFVQFSYVIFGTCMRDFSTFTDAM